MDVYTLSVSFRLNQERVVYPKGNKNILPIIHSSINDSDFDVFSLDSKFMKFIYTSHYTQLVSSYPRNHTNSEPHMYRNSILCKVLASSPPTGTGLGALGLPNDFKGSADVLNTIGTVAFKTGDTARTPGMSLIWASISTFVASLRT